MSDITEARPLPQGLRELPGRAHAAGRIRSALRKAVTTAVSVTVLLSALLYLVAPQGEALATTVSGGVSRQHDVVLYGKALGPGGKPLKGVEIRVAYDHWTTTTGTTIDPKGHPGAPNSGVATSTVVVYTAADGTYRLDIPSGRDEITVVMGAAHHQLRRSIQLFARFGHDYRLNVRITPGGRLFFIPLLSY